MLKNSFIEYLDKYNNRNSLYHTIISFLVDTIIYFKNDYNFDIEGNEKSVSICIDNGGLFLFIDLDEETLNLRYIHNEFYIFIDEIDIEELKLLLTNFFEGKYIMKSFIYEGLIVKQELNFNNQKLIKYNQIDIYSNKKSNEVLEKEGCNWTDPLCEE
ncbi:hypothetical protein [Flavobacterium psychrophilum]|uniref:hypothetical protein n=1 Tax=Flavobacterium psychrophilum TaxID=96345 RepID=UPI0033969014